MMSMSWRTQKMPRLDSKRIAAIRKIEFLQQMRASERSQRRAHRVLPDTENIIFRALRTKALRQKNRYRVHTYNVVTTKIGSQLSFALHP